MRTKMKWEREILDEFSWRYKVMGGWVVYSEIHSNKGSVALASVFIKDQYHEWEIIKEKSKERTVEMESIDFPMR